ncbi:phosphoglycerate mutase-like protein 1 isoform X2 [Durio zibethinus]|uniref:Phosphoglycerate mutase-like protein 1 isoform X2 n=1 Tax=Durio zibethinus TaxID=66656 RepID=A0A6P6AUQ1_DURZI|nr:phosphoglycerate mutase-like protein 1 isoform X2 [Durio zibethinus]
MPSGCRISASGPNRWFLKLVLHVFPGAESSRSERACERASVRASQSQTDAAATKESLTLINNMTISIVCNIQLPSSSYYYSSTSSSSRCISTAPVPLSKRKPIQLPLYRTSAYLSDMDATSTPGLYPLHRCKTLHLVRHAQGIHNVAGEKDYAAYLSEDLFDAHLTPLGWQQVDNLRNHVQETGISKKIELVIVSPLLRTMQTAVGVFGGEGYKDGIVVPPLMVENVGESHRPEISSLNCPPFLAVELCREHLGVHPCDRRKSITEYRPVFPAIDFSLIESNEDSLWEANIREKNEEVAVRGMKFLNWLWTRKEKEIAIVTHSSFLYHTLSAFGSDCHPSVKSEICKHFANCELRSVVIVDRSMMGSDPATTNYPGKIPSGPDLPSDVADEKLSEAGEGK